MTDLERIESKLDKVLHLLGDGKGRTSAELGREADAIIMPRPLSSEKEDFAKMDRLSDVYFVM